ncbi:F0F1 ATP synthase subunit A [Dehalobacterium formicoaceticum]|uniref:ATP synthase subunit a n=1 Tax=Dehalobacterium formicoaceticum TaxID=51515 RepID=A0ABT1Y3I5_9FIRM|nr:F0F1 ATP synthase subunit A [Dehalobacterium formicoaceticum]MCR6545429.1 F0F1 ATP synthase subunit A [Dehalobacterium formicoaceticum]
MEGHGTTALFEIFGLRVSSYVTTMWLVMAVILIFSYFATRNLKKVPSGAQNAMEYIIQVLTEFFSGIMGPKRAKQYLPILVTYFLFILFSNYSGLLPLSGHIPGLAAPTSTISVTAGLAIVVFFCTHFFGIKENGIGYFKHFFQPVAFLFPLMIIEELVRPLSLSLRLYGNIFGEEMVTAQLFAMVPFGVPLIMQLMSILFGLIQAFVFTLLAAVYFGGATADHH